MVVQSFFKITSKDEPVQNLRKVLAEAEEDRHRVSLRDGGTSSLKAGNCVYFEGVSNK
jgi:hypothetical protein